MKAYAEYIEPGYATPAVLAFDTGANRDAFLMYTPEKRGRPLDKDTALATASREWGHYSGHPAVCSLSEHLFHGHLSPPVGLIGEVLVATPDQPWYIRRETAAA